MSAILLLVICIILSASATARKTVICQDSNGCTNTEKDIIYQCGVDFSYVSSCHCGEAYECIGYNVVGDIFCENSGACIAKSSSLATVHGQCSKNVTCQFQSDCFCGAADTCFCSSYYNDDVYIRPDASLIGPPLSIFGSSYTCHRVSSSNGNSACLNAGAIAGIVIAVVVAFALIVYWVYRCRVNNREDRMRASQQTGGIVVLPPANNGFANNQEMTVYPTGTYVQQVPVGGGVNMYGQSQVQHVQILNQHPTAYNQNMANPNMPYPNAQYPNAQYPNAQYPNAQYPNAQYPNMAGQPIYGGQQQVTYNNTGVADPNSSVASAPAFSHDQCGMPVANAVAIGGPVGGVSYGGQQQQQQYNNSGAYGYQQNTNSGAVKDI